MGWFKKERFVTSDTKETFDIYHPTVYKVGAIHIKNKDSTFTKKRV